MLRLRRRRKRATLPPSPLDLANRARDVGDWALAARHYREALAQDSGNPAIWVQYGHALKESGNTADAEKAYRKALEIDGRTADTHLQLGHALKMLGRRDEAAAAYLRALAVESALPHAARELIALCWEPINKFEAGWNQHLPAFLNCVASVNAFAHEQARLMREVEQLRRDVDALVEARRGGSAVTHDASEGTDPHGEGARSGRTVEARAALNGQASPAS
jgi:tetratricopeptide (TPR) repeat protein